MYYQDRNTKGDSTTQSERTVARSVYPRHLDISLSDDLRVVGQEVFLSPSGHTHDAFFPMFQGHSHHVFPWGKFNSIRSIIGLFFGKFLD